VRIKPKANIPQGRFLSMPNKFRGYVAGYRAGKTWAGCMAMCTHVWEFPKINQGYFAPTYPQIRDIFYPTIDEVAFNFGLSAEIKQGNHEVHFYNGRVYRGVTICRSMDKPGSIIGFKIGNALIDEIDTLPINKAEESWRKIIARMSYKISGLKNGIDVCTTPEGFRFVHKLFVQQPIEHPELKNNYGLVQASTYDNEANLPDDYIASLEETYPKELIDAYINGQFVNLTSGTVYGSYNRERCNSTERIKPGEPLTIGMDFNIGLMAATVYVQRPNGYHAVEELHDIFDTPAMAKAISARWRTSDFDKNRQITIYPDASGGKSSGGTVNALGSDFAILQQEGFSIISNPSNPAVRNRVLSMNKQFEIGWLWVNAQNCPTVARCLEQQAYDVNGDPDKKTGFDHQNDASGYPMAYLFPIIRPMSRIKLVGI